MTIPCFSRCLPAAPAPRAGHGSCPPARIRAPRPAPPLPPRPPFPPSPILLPLSACIIVRPRPETGPIPPLDYELRVPQFPRPVRLARGVSISFARQQFSPPTLNLSLRQGRRGTAHTKWGAPLRAPRRNNPHGVNDPGPATLVFVHRAPSPIRTPPLPDGSPCRQPRPSHNTTSPVPLNLHPPADPLEPDEPPARAARRASTIRRHYRSANRPNTAEVSEQSDQAFAVGLVQRGLATTPRPSSGDAIRRPRSCWQAAAGPEAHQ